MRLHSASAAPQMTAKLCEQKRGTFGLDLGDRSATNGSQRAAVLWTPPPLPGADDTAKSLLGLGKFTSDLGSLSHRFLFAVQTSFRAIVSWREVLTTSSISQPIKPSYSVRTRPIRVFNASRKASYRNRSCSCSTRPRKRLKPREPRLVEPKALVNVDASRRADQPRDAIWSLLSTARAGWERKIDFFLPFQPEETLRRGQPPGGCYLLIHPGPCSRQKKDPIPTANAFRSTRN